MMMMLLSESLNKFGIKSEKFETESNKHEVGPGYYYYYYWF